MEPIVTYHKSHAGRSFTKNQSGEDIPAIQDSEDEGTERVYLFGDGKAFILRFEKDEQATTQRLSCDRILKRNANPARTPIIATSSLKGVT